jgi:hypothetical protein
MSEARHGAGAQPGRDMTLAAASVSDMPEIAPAEQYEAIPFPLLDLPTTIGWQWLRPRKGGPSFVLIKRTMLSDKVTDRFPLTEQGWAEAWQALERLDIQAAQKCRAGLAARETGQHIGKPAEMADLDKRTLGALRGAALLGGYAPDAAIAVGERSQRALPG